MNKKFLSAFSLTFSLLLMQACANNNEEDLYGNEPPVECKTTELSYQANIKPILDLNCSFSGCHGAVAPSGNINLSTVEGIRAVSVELFVNSINHAPGAYAMPPTGQKLPQCSIDQITAWLNDGAPDN
jgi:hypothetical protein